MKDRHERRALAAGGNVALTEVADHGDAGGFGQRMRCIELNRVAAARLVTDRLAVGANRGDLRRVDAGFLQ